MAQVPISRLAWPRKPAISRDRGDGFRPCTRCYDRAGLVLGVQQRGRREVQAGVRERGVRSRGRQGARPLRATWRTGPFGGAAQLARADDLRAHVGAVHVLRDVHLRLRRRDLGHRRGGHRHVRENDQLPDRPRQARHVHHQQLQQAACGLCEAARVEGHRFHEPHHGGEAGHDDQRFVHDSEVLARLEAEGEQLEEHENVHRSQVVDLEDSNPGYEEEEADLNNSYVEGSAEDNDNSQESFVDFEEKVPPLRIKLPSPSSTTTSPNVPPDSTSGPSLDKNEVRASVLDSEEDEEVDDQLEIIDENTINEEEEGDPADAPIGIIINESSEDGQGINDVVMVGDQLADKDDLEETL